MTVLALIFRIVLGIHIIAGAAALLVFWIPLVTRKGGRTHRRAGWAYVTAAAIVAVTGIASAGRLMVYDPRPHAWRAGIFLVYVGLFAAESALLGARALRPHTRADSVNNAVDLVPSLLLVAGGVALVAFGVSQAQLLFVLFAALGVGQGAMHLRSWLTHRKNREGRERAAPRDAHVRPAPLGRPDRGPQPRAGDRAASLREALRAGRRAAGVDPPRGRLIAVS